MTPQETAEALATIQVFDNRKVDELTIKTWHKQLWKYTLDDVLQATYDYFGTETEYLKPAHIIGRVKSIRARRVEIMGGVHLNHIDEYDDDGSRLPDAEQKQTHLLEIVKSGYLTKSRYLAYQRGQLTFDELAEDTAPRQQLN